MAQIVTICSNLNLIAGAPSVVNSGIRNSVMSVSLTEGVMTVCDSKTVMIVSLTEGVMTVCNSDAVMVVVMITGVMHVRIINHGTILGKMEIVSSTMQGKAIIVKRGLTVTCGDMTMNPVITIADLLTEIEHGISQVLVSMDGIIAGSRTTTDKVQGFFRQQGMIIAGMSRMCPEPVP
jgi:hypothetical protein